MAQAWGYSLEAEHLPSMRKALVLSPSTIKIKQEVGTKREIWQLM